jgi:hypothetical protein
MVFPEHCTRCGERRARFHEVEVFGPLTLAEHYLCEACAASDGRAVRADEALTSEPPGDEGMSSVDEWAPTTEGPIQFDVLWPTVVRAEADEPEELLAFLASALRRIADHRGQSLPPDVRAFVDRHSA